MNIFGRWKDEIPRELGRGNPVKSPLLLMANKDDLRGFERVRSKGFAEPPPALVELSEEEIQKRREDYERLFGGVSAAKFRSDGYSTFRPSGEQTDFSEFKNLLG